MNTLVRLAGVGIAILGIAYVAVPKQIYHVGFGFLRSAQSEPSDPSSVVVWVYRFIGVCLLVLGVSHLS